MTLLFSLNFVQYVSFVVHLHHKYVNMIKKMIKTVCMQTIKKFKSKTNALKSLWLINSVIEIIIKTTYTKKNSYIEFLTVSKISKS